MASERQASETKAGAVESAGVDALIGRLRDQGIAEGRTQADALVAAARREAAEILSKARRDAEQVAAQAKESAAKLEAAGEDAVRLAMRDTVLSLEGDLLKGFVERLRHLVKGVLVDPAFLQRMILEITGEATRPSAGKERTLLLPAGLVSLEDLQRKPEEAKPDTLMHFVLSMGGAMLRDGMRFGVADDGEAGIRVRVVDEDVQIDLTEGAITELLLRHMVPRFRALLRGAVAAPAQARPARS